MAHNTPTKICLICEKKWKGVTWQQSRNRACSRCRHKKIFGQPVSSKLIWDLRRRLTRFRQKGNYQRIYYIRCFTKFCTNELRFDPREQGKGICRFCKIKLPVRGRSRVACRNRNCKKTVSIKQSWLSSGRKVACKHCSVKRIHGHAIGRFDVWDLRKFCTGVERSPSGRRGFLITCKLRGCSRTYKYQSRHKGKRQFCGEHSKRMYGLSEYGPLYGILRRAVQTNSNKILDLSYSEFTKFCQTQQICVYCKKRVVRKKGGLRRGKDNFAYYIDRLDRMKGYCVDNIVTACDSCNLTKSDKLSPQEMSVVAAMRRNRVKDAQALIAQKHPPENWPGKVWRIADSRWRKLRQYYLDLRSQRRLLKIAQASRLKVPKP